MTDGTSKSDTQQAAEADVQSFRKRMGPFVVAAESTRMPMVFTDARDPGRPIVFANDSFLALSGYRRDEALGSGVGALMGRDADAGALACIEAAFDGGDGPDPEVLFRRKDRSDLWVSVSVSPVNDEEGRVVEHFVSFVDVTAHRERHAHSRMLIDELNHRVKNTLSTVQSIVSRAMRSSGDIAVVREAVESRLFALSRSHDLLTRVNWEAAELREVVANALEPYGASDGRAERCVVAGPDVPLPPKAALALGVAFNELATNAVKYGAFSDEGGRIAVSWSIEPAPGGDRLRLRWREQGGPPVAPPTRRGFGSQMIERGLAHELRGTVRLDYPVEGVVCLIDVPVPRHAGDG